MSLPLASKPLVADPLMQSPALHWIDGQWVDSAKHTDSIDPATGEVIGSYADGGKEEAAKAADAARRVFDETDWKDNRALRAKVLNQLADRFEARREDLIQILATENGKVIAEATFQLDMAIAARPTLSPYTSKQNFDSKTSDHALAKMILATAGMVYHSVGTARMGADGDPAAVLDPQLRVRGVEGLRGIDASAMPETIRGHAMAPTFYVAERGCELIRGTTL